MLQNAGESQFSPTADEGAGDALAFFLSASFCPFFDFFGFGAGLGLRSGGMYPGGYEIIWIWCGLRCRAWISGVGKLGAALRFFRSRGFLGV